MSLLQEQQKSNVFFTCSYSKQDKKISRSSMGVMCIAPRGTFYLEQRGNPVKKRHFFFQIRSGSRYMEHAGNSNQHSGECVLQRKGLPGKCSRKNFLILIQATAQTLRGMRSPEIRPPREINEQWNSKQLSELKVCLFSNNLCALPTACSCLF